MTNDLQGHGASFAETRPSHPRPPADADTDQHETKPPPNYRRQCLHVLVGPDEGKRFRLRQGETVLGRGGRGFTDREVSRRHALLVVRGTQVWVEDLGSRNGTYVGIDKIVSPSLLRDGETFYLGFKTLILLTSADAEGAT
jgi:pSer/pThr/pTyr-binding forkhead associated (FHA) protein